MAYAAQDEVNAAISNGDIYVLYYATKRQIRELIRKEKQSKGLYRDWQKAQNKLKDEMKGVKL